MSNSQKTLIEKDETKAEETKKSTKSPSRAQTAKEAYAKMEVANEKLYGNIVAENKSLRDSIEASNQKVIELTNSMKESNDKVAVTLIETEEKLEQLTGLTEALTQRLDEMNTVDVSEAPVAPAGTSAPEPAVQSAPVDLGNIQEYVTSRDAFNRYLKEFSRRDGELADKHFKNILEKICLMKVDYEKLCSNAQKDIKMYSAQDILNSFSAYLVDIENIIVDAGVVIGPYGNEGDQIDPMHQRIVNVVPTDDPAKNGVVAERLAPGYEYNGRAIVKEKVNVYKVPDENPEPAPAPAEPVEREILG